MTKIDNCRFCKTAIVEIINFGKMPIANAFLIEEDVKNEYFFELAAGYCPKCSLFQLIEQPNPDFLFHENYAFFADTSKYMQKHFRKYAEWIENEFCRLAVLSRWKHKQKAFKIFIIPKYKVENTYRWVDKRSCKEIDSSFYDSLDEISIDGKIFPVPHNTEEYLLQMTKREDLIPVMKYL